MQFYGTRINLVHFNREIELEISITADRLAQLVERRTSVREVSGSSPDRTNTQGLKITEENMLPLQ